MKLIDIEGLRAWANIVINNQETYEVPEVTTLVDIYNTDDTAYLGIDVYVSRTTVNQYTFLSEEDNDKPGRLVLLFDFLKSVDFSLAKLLKWLGDARFAASEMGDRVLTHGLAIYREFLTDTEQMQY